MITSCCQLREPCHSILKTIDVEGSKTSKGNSYMSKGSSNRMHLAPKLHVFSTHFHLKANTVYLSSLGSAPFSIFFKKNSENPKNLPELFPRLELRGLSAADGLRHARHLHRHRGDVLGGRQKAFGMLGVFGRIFG